MTTLSINAAPVTDDADKTVLFTVSGRDYRVDAEPDASILLRFMWTVKTDELGAIRDLLVEMLGEDAYQDLMNTKGISKPAFRSIVNATLAHLGGADDTDPKAPPANRAARRGKGT